MRCFEELGTVHESLCHAGEVLSKPYPNHALQCLQKACTPLGENCKVTAFRKPKKQCPRVCATPGKSFKKVVAKSRPKRDCLTADRPKEKSVQTIHTGFTHDSQGIHTLLGAQRDNHGSERWWWLNAERNPCGPCGVGILVVICREG